MDIATPPAARERSRSKRSDRRSAAAADKHVIKIAGGDGHPIPKRQAEDLVNGTKARAELKRARTSLHRAEQELDIANQRLDASDAARRHLLDNVASGGDEARKRFASALHDDALQLLTAAELQLERIRIDARKTRYAAPLDDLKLTIKQVEESLRNLLYNVSPAAPDVHVSLSKALRDRLVGLKAHTGIEPDLDMRLPDDLADGTKSIILQNISEAVSNVEKHANATKVSVTAQLVDGGISVVVADDGTGYVVAESLYLPGHLGLLAMRERALLAGGWCRFESDPGAGARVDFWIPNV